MRADMCGFFWNDTPPPKPPTKEAPHERVQERPGSEVHQPARPAEGWQVHRHDQPRRAIRRAAQLRLEGSEKSIRIAQSNFYPQLSLGAGLGTNYYTLNGEAEVAFGSQLKNNLNKYIGFNLNVPLFNRFTTRNRVRTARLQQMNFALQLDQTKKALYKEIQQAWYNAVAAESNYNSSLVAVQANEESFRLMNEKFDNGKATAVEYNEAKQLLVKALSDNIQAKYDYLFRTKILDFYKGRMIE